MKTDIADINKQIPLADYYRLLGIYRTSKFDKDYNDLLTKVAKVKCKIPTEGFKTVKSSTKWRNKLDKTSIDINEEIEQILLDFGISTDYKEFEIYRDMLKAKIYFKANPKIQYLTEKPIDLVFHPDPDDRDILWIKVSRFCRQKDWNDYYPTVHRFQDTLPGIHTKVSNKLEGFERNFELYMLYLKIEFDIKNNNLPSEIKYTHKKRLFRKNLSLIPIMKDYPQYNEIITKYKNKGKLKEITDESLDRIINKYKKLYQGLILL